MTVDFYRPSSTKDLSGWTGPAVVTDTSGIPRGIIKIKYKRDEMNMSPGDLRPYLEFIVFSSAPHVNNVTANVFTAIQHAVEALQDKSTMNLGRVPTSEDSCRGAEQMTKSTGLNQKTWAAVQSLAHHTVSPLHGALSLAKARRR